MRKKKAKYAISCVFDKEKVTKDSIFFVVFNTKDEKKALELAKCVCGKKAHKALVIITEDGEIIELD